MHHDLPEGLGGGANALANECHSVVVSFRRPMVGRRRISTAARHPGDPVDYGHDGLTPSKPSVLRFGQNCKLTIGAGARGDDLPRLLDLGRAVQFARIKGDLVNERFQVFRT